MDILGSLIGMLVKFVFKIILKLFDIIFAPFILMFTSIFPDLSGVLNTMLSFITNYIVPYVKFGLSLLYNLLGVPPWLISLLATYLLAIITGKAISTAVIFALNVYEKLKP